MEIAKQVLENEKTNVHIKMVDVLSRVTPSMMKEAQEEDVYTSKMICYVKSCRKPMLAQIQKIQVKSCAKVSLAVCSTGILPGGTAQSL